MNFIQLTLFPAVLYLLWVGIQKAIIEPIAQRLVLSGIKQFIGPTWEALDDRLAAPGAFADWSRLGRRWLYQQIIPEEAKTVLSPQQLADLLGVIEKEFSVKKHQEKAHGRN